MWIECSTNHSVQICYQKKNLLVSISKQKWCKFPVYVTYMICEFNVVQICYQIRCKFSKKILVSISKQMWCKFPVYVTYMICEFNVIQICYQIRWKFSGRELLPNVVQIISICNIEKILLCTNPQTKVVQITSISNIEKNST